VSLRLEKKWTDLTQTAVRSLPGQLGVYQLAEPDAGIFYIGYAGGHSLFGLRSELQRWLDRRAGIPARFRYEINMQYTTRHQELLMLYVADHGNLPVENTDVNIKQLGRLRPG
jgi:hypothetical protein